nr:serine/threonine protein kinase [Acidobacteriota bacterium]
AQAVSALNHPNIVTIFDVGDDAGTNFIATEYVEGRTLREVLNGGKPPLLDVLKIAAQVCEALEAAHESGVVHRDIKPENVMLRPDGYVKVLDFGLAKLTEEANPALSQAPTLAAFRTDPGVVMGTLQYMSPEQARGISVDERTDIWSLGCVLYEMVAGRAPFRGETTSDALAAVLATEPPPLARFTPRAPEGQTPSPTGQVQPAQQTLLLSSLIGPRGSSRRRAAFSLAAALFVCAALAFALYKL